VLALILEVFRIAEDLYALSPTQREALERYVNAAKSAREEKKAKEEQREKEEQKEHQKDRQKILQVHEKKKKRATNNKGRSESEREIELRAARQAALFAQVWFLALGSVLCWQVF
jgi:Flp pilus assembly protein TadB